MSENRWISMKISFHLWKCLNIAEYLWKSFNLTENVWEQLWTSMKISVHLWKCLNITENLWKLLSQVWNVLKTFVGALHCRMVFDLCFVNFVWTTSKKTLEEKEKNKQLGQNQTHIRQKSVTKWASACFRGCYWNGFIHYPTLSPQSAIRI